jgi:hypothetical protein
VIFSLLFSVIIIVGRHRVCTTTGSKPIDTFLLEEKECLLPIPSGVFDMPIWTRCRVQKDHHFVVKGNFYSVIH